MRRRILLKNGWLIIFVPAFQILWGELDKRSKYYRRYTKPRIINLFEDCGFRIEHASYFNFLFFLPILFIRIFQERIFQKLHLGKSANWGIDPIIGSMLINKILTVIFFADIYLSRFISPPFGVSLCLIAKKR